MPSGSGRNNAPRYPHTQRFKDRFGKLRVYFRRRGSPRIPLPLPEGSPEFVRAYALALAGGGFEGTDPPGSGSRIKGKTWDAAIAGVTGSTKYRKLADNTKRNHRRMFKMIHEDFGSVPVAEMTAKQAAKLIDAKAQRTPGEAAGLLSSFRVLSEFAIGEEWRGDNPFAKVSKPEIGTHHTWTAAEIAQYRRHWKLGTFERLALELLYSTGLRLEDAISIGPQHVTAGVARIELGKTPGQYSVFGMAHVPELTEALAATSAVGIETWLIAPSNGRRFTEWQFGRLFRQAATAAGLPSGRTAHGLRKACFTRLAESGLTVHEIMAWSGHADVKTVMLYTRAAEQTRLAQSGGAKLAGRG